MEDVVLYPTTHEYDEMMLDEGGEFFVLYKKANPHYRRKVVKYDSK